MRQSKRIAITGGIGSGKSTVAEMIRGLGYKVFSCDEIYGELLKDKGFLNKLEAAFPGTILPDGSPDRGKLSQIVFSDKVALEKLNRLTHPAIMEEAFKRMAAYYISFLEVPLLFESHSEGNFDAVIVVLRGLEDRYKAVAKRSKLCRADFEKRVKSQINYENYDFSKYYVIHNNSNLDDLRQKIAAMVNLIIG